MITEERSIRLTVLVCAMFALYGAECRAGERFVPPSQFVDRLASRGVELPVIRSSQCVAEQLRVVVKVDEHGKLKSVQPFKGKGRSRVRQWADSVVQKAREALSFTYAPFTIGNKPTGIKTVLSLRCESVPPDMSGIAQ